MLSILAAFLIAGAGLPTPTPFAEVDATRAGDCIGVPEIVADVSEMVGMYGGIGMRLDAKAAQKLGDAWRASIGKPPVELSLDLIWANNSLVSLNEFDAHHCLLTSTVMSIPEYMEVLATIKKGGAI